jgi:hypothetical protein
LPEVWDSVSAVSKSFSGPTKPVGSSIRAPRVSTDWLNSTCAQFFSCLSSSSRLSRWISGCAGLSSSTAWRGIPVPRSRCMRLISISGSLLTMHAGEVVSRAKLRALDGINPADPGFADALAGGVTTAVILPGSANPIGGQAVAVKCAGRTVADMVLREPAGVKSALGENPNRPQLGAGPIPRTAGRPGGQGGT